MLNSLNLHRIVKIEIGNVQTLFRKKAKDSFTTRDVIFTNENGETFTISAFGETEADLNLGVK